MAPCAVFRSPLPYADVTSNNGNTTDSNMVANSKEKLVNESIVIEPLKKLPKSERRCKSRHRPKGGTFYLRRTKGKGCKRQKKLNTTTPSQMSTVSATSLSMEVSHLNEIKSTAALPIKKRLGKKKSNGQGLSDYVTQRSQIPPPANMSSDQKTATQSLPSFTRKPVLQPHRVTAPPAVGKSRKKVPKQQQQRRCCGLRTSVRGDTFQPRCKSCLEQKATSGMTTVTQSKTMYVVPVKMSTNSTRILKRTETPQQDDPKTLWSTAASATSVHNEVKPQKQMDSPLQQNDTSRGLMCTNVAQSTNAGRGLKQNFASDNMTGECMPLRIHHICCGHFSAYQASVIHYWDHVFSLYNSAIASNAATRKAEYNGWHLKEPTMTLGMSLIRRRSSVLSL